MWSYNYTSELYHHGVKGQKWGVRRYQYPDGSLKPNGYSHYGRTPPKKIENRNPYVSTGVKSIKAVAGFKRNNSDYGVTNLRGVDSDDTYSGHTNGVHMDKGSVISRIQAYEKEIGGGAAFVAGTKNDAERYEDVNIVKNLKSNSSSLWGGKYRVQYKLTQDLDAPSENIARKLLGETLKGNKDNVDAMLVTLKYQSEQRNDKGVIKVIKQYQAYKDCYQAYVKGEATYRMMSRLSNVSGEGATNNIKNMSKEKNLTTLSIRDEYYKKLSSKGYNAVLDYNDLGRMSTVPMIIFDRDALMRQYKSYDIVENYKQKKKAI